MKKISVAFLSFIMFVSLAGCSMGSNEKEEPKKEGTTDKKETDMTTVNEGSVEDMMSYMKEKGITYSDDTKLSQFDWAAKEGTSFNYNDQSIYLYRVDPNDSSMDGLLKNVNENNMITANQNGTEMQYGARVNGNYLLVYDKQAALDELVKIFDDYKYNTKGNDAK